MCLTSPPLQCFDLCTHQTKKQANYEDHNPGWQILLELAGKSPASARMVCMHEKQATPISHKQWHLPQATNKSKKKYVSK